MGAVRYEIRVKGREPAEVLATVQEGWEVATAPARTVVRGLLPDQAALAGMLNQIRLLGLELVEVRRLPRGGRPVRSAS